MLLCELFNNDRSTLNEHLRFIRSGDRITREDDNKTKQTLVKKIRFVVKRTSKRETQ